MDSERKNEYLSLEHSTGRRSIKRASVSGMGDLAMSVRPASKGMNQLEISVKKGKLLRCEKVLMNTSAPSCCSSVSSRSLSATPLFASISSHSGLASGSAGSRSPLLMLSII